MRRTALPVVALALIALLGVASTQEDCTAQVAEAVSPVQKKLDESKAQYATLYTTWQKQTADIDELKASVSTLTSQLEVAKAAAGAKPKLDLPTIAVALVDLTKEAALATWAEIKAVVAELQTGKSTKLQAHVANTLSIVRGALSSSVAFVRKEVDEHLPEPVKKQLALAAAQVQALWKQHVTDAAWAQPLIKELLSVNAEVTKVVTKALTSTPALAPLADPVTIQLAVYAVFVLPLLVAVVVLALLLGGKKKPQAASAASAFGKKKKARGKA